MSKRKKKSRKKPILEGYKRVGKRFIPPMMQLPMSTDISYVNDMLPELIWVGLINEREGFVGGARIIEKIFLAVDEIKEEGQEGNYALMSSFNILRLDQKTSVNERLQAEGTLETIQNSIAPLVLLYDGCPLSFVGHPTTKYGENYLVSTIKECVGRTIDRYETPAVVLYGAMLIARLVTKTISLPAGMDLPDFNAVVDSPDSEEAKRAAGFMRASGLAEFGMLNISNEWAKHFWNRNFSLSPCEFE